MAELSAQEQDLVERRLRAVDLVEQGQTMRRAATLVGLHRSTVSRAVRLHAAEGPERLVPSKRGRKPLLSEEQHRRLAELVAEKQPSDVDLTGRYWTREQTVALIERETGHRVSKQHAGRLLNRWGVERLRGRPPGSAQGKP